MGGAVAAFGPKVGSESARIPAVTLSNRAVLLAAVPSKDLG